MANQLSNQVAKWLQQPPPSRLVLQDVAQLSLHVALTGCHKGITRVVSESSLICNYSSLITQPLSEICFKSREESIKALSSITRKANITPIKHLSSTYLAPSCTHPTSPLSSSGPKSDISGSGGTTTSGSVGSASGGGGGGRAQGAVGAAGATGCGGG